MKNNKKHVDYIVAFRERYGKYPNFIHRSLSGGDAFTDFFTKTLPGGFTSAADALAHGFDEFGNDLKTGFGVVGNFIANHKSAFIQAIVMGALLVLFPEMAPVILQAGLPDLMTQISGAAPVGSAVPTQADIDKAIAAFKADPRYDQMMARCSAFIKNFSQYVKNDISTTVTAANLSGGRGNSGYTPTWYYSWTRPTGTTMAVINGGDIVLHYPGANGDMVAPVQICLKTAGDSLMNYLIPIKNQTDGWSYVTETYLNADGSNYKDLAKRINMISYSR